MKISGYTFGANIKGKLFPYRACIESLFLLVDEVCIAYDPRYDNPEDFTSIDPRIKAVDCVMNLGSIMGYGNQLNAAKKECQGDWIIMLGLDEIIHEKDADSILNLIEYADRNGYNGVNLSMCNFITPKYVFGQQLGFWGLRTNISKNIKEISHGCISDAIIPNGDHVYLNTGDGADWVLEGRLFHHECLIHRDYVFMNKIQKGIATAEDVVETTTQFPYIYHYSKYNIQRKRKMNMHQREYSIQHLIEENDVDLWQKALSEPVILDNEPESAQGDVIGPVELSHPRVITEWRNAIDKMTGN